MMRNNKYTLGSRILIVIICLTVLYAFFHIYINNTVFHNTLIKSATNDILNNNTHSMLNAHKTILEAIWKHK